MRETVLLSPCQQRTWILDLLNEQPPVHYSVALDMDGPVDLAALCWCWRALVSCNELLRLTVLLEDGAPVPFVGQPQSRVSFVDVSAVNGGADPVQTSWQSRPLWVHQSCCDALLLRLGPARHRLLLRCHGLVVDRRSMDLAVKELVRVYEERLWAGPMSLHETGEAFFAGCRERRAFFQAREGRRLLGWWARYLGETPRCLTWADRPPEGFRLNRVDLDLDGTLLAGLERPAGLRGGTLSDLLLATFALLLHYYSGREDLMIGVFYENRDERNQHTIGPFDTLVPRRFQPRPNQPFSGLLSDQVAERKELERVGIPPFSLLLRELRPDWCFGREVLCQVAFSMWSEGLAPETIGPAILRGKHVPGRFNRLELRLNFDPDAQRVSLFYNEGMLVEAEAYRLLEHLLLLLNRLLDHPHRTVAEMRPEGLNMRGMTLAGPAGPGPSHGLFSSDWIDDEVRLILEQALGGKAELTPEVNLFEAGLDSLDLLRLVVRLRKAFSLTLPLSYALDFPHGAGLAAYIRRALLAPVPLEIESVVDLRGEVPLSAKQKRLWFLQYLRGGGSVWHHAFVFRLRGPLEPEHLRDALTALVERHTVLQTIVRMEEGRPRAYLKPSYQLFPIHDLAHLNKADARRRADEIMTDKVGKGFVDDGGALFRPSLIKFGENNHLLLVVVHRMICDRPSLAILQGELARLYGAKVSGELPDLAPRTLQYADYVHWQRGSGAAVLAGQLSYWEKQLKNLSSGDLFGGDRAATDKPSHEGDISSFKLDQGLTFLLHSQAQRQGVSLATLFQGCFALLLARRLHQGDLVLGSPMNLRSGDLMGMVGPLSQWLMLRHDLSENTSFGDYLRAVRLMRLQAFENSDVPYEQVVEALSPARSSTHEALCQVLFQFRHSPAGCADWLELGVTNEGLPLVAVQHDLSLELTVEKGAVTGTLVYATDLFDERTIAGIADQYQHLLTSVSQQKEAFLAELEIQGEQARADLTANWSKSEPPEGAGRYCIHHLFAAHVRRQPEKTAVLDGEAWCYRALDVAVAKVAGCLDRYGVDPAEPVAILGENGVFFAAALLGVLAAGGCCVPIDPAWPPEKRAAVLADSGVCHMLVCDEGESAVNSLRVSRILGQEVAAYPEVTVLPDQAALIRYDWDGSGGLVGLVHSHRAAVSFILAMGASREAGRVVLGSRRQLRDCLSFPLLELCSGATIAFEEAAQEAGPDFTHQHYWGRSHDDGGCLLLHHGWEDQLERIAPAEGSCLYYEALEVGSWWAMREVSPTKSYRLSPLVRVFLLDLFGAPVAPGGRGALLLGGQSLGFGYWGKPGKTAAVFVPDPFCPRGGRLFKTGLPARVDGEGGIEVCGQGRTELIAGTNLVHPDDVACVLAGHPDIADVSLAVERTKHGKELVAWIATADGVALSSSRLRAWLSRRLPEYALPTRIHFTRELPGQSPLATAMNAPLPQSPRNRAEAVLVGIYKAVLCCGTLGINDHFFYLGGHSLLVPRVIALIVEKLSLHLPPRLIFRYPRIRDLAAALEDFGDRPQPLPRLLEQGEPLLSPAQRRFYRPEQPEGVLPFHRVLARRFFGRLFPHALEQAVHLLQRRQAILRTRLFEEDGAVRFSLKGPPVMLAFIDLTEPAQAQVEACLEELQARFFAIPFPLDGPLWRISLVAVDAWDHVLLICVHPLICDRSSTHVLIDELALCYRESLAQTEPENLEPAYSGFASAQLHRQWDPAYWQKQLVDVRPGLSFPTDFPEVSQSTGQGGQLHFMLPEPLERSLTSLAHAQGTTLFVALQGVLCSLIYRYSGDGRVLLGTPVSLRERTEMDRLIGVFSNPVMLLGRLKPEMSFLDLLQHLGKVTSEAFAHGQVPYARVVEALDLPEGTADPLFRVVFECRRKVPAAPAWPNLESVVLAPRPGFARYDLSLTYQQAEEGLHGTLTYRTDLFAEATMIRLCHQLSALPETMLANPEKSISRLDLLDPMERQLLLQTWGEQDAPPDCGPLLGRRFYVLDPDGALLPIGFVGELYVGGAGLARGYVGDPRRTALRYQPDAYGKVAGARLFQTGERARYKIGGSIEHLGET